MKKHLCNLILMVAVMSPLFAQKTIKRSVFFETNQAQLTETNFNYLQSLADTLKRYADYSISLKGNTDADGSDQFNQKLSEKRVLAVKQQLEKNGISYAIFNQEALGEHQPEADNTTLDGKQRNRRVDIFITFPPKTIAAQPSSKHYQTIQDLYADLKTPPQYFSLKTGRDTVITGAKGTVLYIPKGAFAGVPANAIVDFSLKECYSFLDIVSENLTTISDDKILQTGGMFNAVATYKGKSVDLQKDIKVSFASPESQLEGMQLFIGNRNPQNGKMNWTPINNTPTKTDKFDDETELIVYSQGGKFNPYILTDGSKALTFKEIMDTAQCKPLLTKAQMDRMQKGERIEFKKLSNVGLALSLYQYYNPIIKYNSLIDLHRSAFDDVYTLYKVNSFDDLKKQNGVSWDSLMQVRMDFMGLSEKGKKRRKAYRDSVEQEQKIHSETYDKYIKEQKKFRKEFALQNLGWINCDRFYNIKSTETLTTDLISNRTNTFDVKQIQKTDFSYTFDIFLYFTQQKGCFNYNEQKDKLYFHKIPTHEKAIVLAMKIDNGQPYLAIHNITTAKMHVNLDFKPVSAEEIKEKMKMIQ
jgi:hypothetical protein